MQVRIFRVSFDKLGELPELAFGEQDYLMIRPLFALPRGEADGLLARLRALTPEDGERAAQQIVLDLMAACVTEWHLAGTDGTAIARPATAADLDALPASLAGALSTFFWTFRGEGPHPTTAA